MALAIVSAVSFISVPISVSYFGTEQYGLFSLVGDTLAYLALANLGIPNAVVTAFANLNGDRARRRLVRNGLIVSSLVALILLLLLFVVILRPAIVFMILGKVSEDIAVVVLKFFVISVFFFILQFPLSMYGQLLTYTGNIHIIKIINIVTSILTILVLIFVVKYKMSIVDFIFINGVIGFGGAFIAAILFYKVFSKDKNKFSGVEEDNNQQASLKNLLNRSAFYFINSISGVLIMNTDNLVISHNLGLAEVSQYSVANKIVLLLISIMVQYITVFVSEFPKYKEQSEEVTVIVNKLSHRFCIAFLAVAIAISLFLEAFIKIWTHNNVTISHELALWFSLYILCIGVSQIPYYFLYSLDMVNSFYKFAIFEGVLNLSLSLVLVRYFGVVGVIFSTFFAHLCCSTIVFNVLCYKNFSNIFPIKLLRSVVIYSVLTTLVVIAINYFMK